MFAMTVVAERPGPKIKPEGRYASKSSDASSCARRTSLSLLRCSLSLAPTRPFKNLLMPQFSIVCFPMGFSRGKRAPQDEIGTMPHEGW